MSDAPRKVSPSMAKASQKYQKNALDRHSVNFNRTTDQDIIQHLSTLAIPLQTYVKQLIREDMVRHAVPPEK